MANDASNDTITLHSHGGETTWWMNRDVMKPLGIDVARLVARTDRNAARGGYLEWHFAATADSGFALQLSGTRFERLGAGVLRHRGGPVLSLPNGELDLRGFRLQRQGAGVFGLEVTDAQGTVWFRLDHAHEYFDAGSNSFSARYMDLRLAPAFARRLGHPEFAGLLIGGMQTRGDVANAAVASETQSCSAPWPPADARHGAPWADVRMTNLAANWEEREPDGVNVYRCGRDDGHGDHGLACSETSTDGLVVISPDASLRSEGTAAVAWHPKFTAPSPPYGNDQHPFLVWNLYRLDADGRLHQIGASALKHAFHTINAACGCAQGEVLYPTCEDTYGGFSNDYPSALAPRNEIIPHTAQWGRCGSLYDKDCDGVADADQGALPDDDYTPSKHLAAREAELSATLHPSARWFVEYWYVVRDDIDPYNNFSLREVTPQKVRAQGTDPNAYLWRLDGGEFRNGPMVDRWTALAPPGSYAQVAERDSAYGRLRVASRATPQPGGRWRYDYAVLNLDYMRATTSGAEPNLRILGNRGVISAAVAVGAGANPGGIGFVGVDSQRVLSPWSATVDATHVSWTAPANNPLDWGLTYTYSFFASLPPTPGVMVFGDGAASTPPLNVAVLAPVETVTALPRR